MNPTPSRRDFLRTSAVAGAASVLPWMLPATRTMADETKSPNERPRVGCIGNGGRGGANAKAVSRYGDIVAFCDVDRSHAENLRQALTKGKGEIFEDYHKLLDRKDIDLVTISTPDHWHVKIALDALRAGKDVYCEKPVTLTIDEGKILSRVVQETKRVFQVGTQQRSEFKNMFLTAVALVREGRIGKVKRITCAIGTAQKGGPFAKTTPPATLNWDLWLGQAPKVDYIKERCHGTFRWWYEYSGGKLTDWGAHHVDIAQWAIGMEASGPQTVEVAASEFPQPLQKGMPTRDDTYNTCMSFDVHCRFANGVDLVIRNDAKDLDFGNGILFEGDKGKFFVNRSKLTGEPVEALQKDPIPESVLVKLRKGKRLDSHMGNFIECVRDRSTPVSDIFSHHRTLSTCHLANIALRLGRRLKWDVEAQQILGDEEANAFQRRPQRKGFEVA